MIPGNIYTVEEEIHIVAGVYEADLIHDNITHDTIAVFTGSKCTGKRINSFAISTPSLAPWKTHIKIFTSENVVYVTYETVGDTVEADDINSAQHAIADTQKALNAEITRATNKENALQTSINNEITRASNKENAITTNLNNEIARAKKAESDEATRAKNAEGTLTTNLSNEITRANNAEKTLTTNLNNEISRATNAENSIKNTINTNKPKWDDKYTKAEVDNKISAVITNVAWKDAVSTFADLATTYPSAQAGWTVYVDDTGETYRYDGSSWVRISSYNLPLASSTHDGRMSKGDKSFLDSVRSAWTNVTTHISDTVKHITSAERTLWNTVSNKADKSHNHTKSQITDMPTKLSQFTNDKGFITSADVNTSQNHMHSNMSVLNGITSSNISVWNDSIRRTAFVGSDAENTNGWYKVAEQTCSGYGDTNITFMVTSTYSNYSVGILQLQIRSDSTSISCRTLKWLTRIGFNESNYIVVINGMKWTLYVYQTCPRYGRIAFEILSMSSINNKNMGWTLTFKDNNTKEANAPVATVKSSDGATVNYATSATKAVQDSDGRQINTTYVKKGMTWNQLEGK